MNAKPPIENEPRNVRVSLPDDVWRALRHVALDQGTSLRALLLEGARLVLKKRSGR